MSEIFAQFQNIINGLMFNIPTVGILAIVLYGYSMVPMPSFQGAGYLQEALKWVLIVTFLHTNLVTHPLN